MKKMIASWQYFKYLCRHKWYVLIECYRLGILWRGLVHDLSKFLPSEFFAYRNYFCGGYDHDMMPKPIDEAFDYAWHWHLKRNKHHWQWWILKYDEGNLKVFEMPDVYRKEMLADWIGAGKAITGKNGVFEWYQSNKNKMVLAEYTRSWLEEQINGYRYFEAS